MPACLWPVAQDAQAACSQSQNHLPALPTWAQMPQYSAAFVAAASETQLLLTPNAPLQLVLCCSSGLAPSTGPTSRTLLPWLGGRTRWR